MRQKLESQKPGAQKPGAKKPWHGRFSEQTDPRLEAFSESVSFDRRLYAHDIRASKAHAEMLCAVGIINAGERDAIVGGLAEIQQEIERGEFRWSAALEDVHMNIEARLTERIGAAGKKLHTARSRNDQVATDVRLYTRERIDRLSGLLGTVRLELARLARRYADTIMPGYTHMQAAQPVTFGHHMLAWQEMLRRDAARLRDCRKRVNVSPLGAAALAGSGYPIDRAMTAELLGFEALAENSLDAVSDRDFALEFIAACALIMTHLSRMAEELVLWASPQFDFIELPERYCTGSSIMPQKKNPDVPELLRGKSGRVNGDLVAMLTIMKAQPLAYNRDNQEDKEPLFDAVDTVESCLELFAALPPALTPKADNMRRAAGSGYPTATDLADYLVGKGVPFRDAHAIVGKAVAQAERGGVDLADISLEAYRSLSSRIGPDVYAVLSVEGAVAARDHIGGTAPRQVAAAARRVLAELGDDMGDDKGEEMGDAPGDEMSNAPDNESGNNPPAKPDHA